MDGLLLFRSPLKNSDIPTSIANVEYICVQKELNTWTTVVSKKKNSVSADHKNLCTLCKLEVINYADKGSPVEPVPSQMIPDHTHASALFRHCNFSNILSSMSTPYTFALLVCLHSMARGNFTFSFYAKVSQCVLHVPPILTFPTVKPSNLTDSRPN
jgi:hypothetical protein